MTSDARMASFMIACLCACGAASTVTAQTITHGSCRSTCYAVEVDAILHAGPDFGTVELLWSVEILPEGDTKGPEPTIWRDGQLAWSLRDGLTAIGIATYKRGAVTAQAESIALQGTGVRRVVLRLEQVGVGTPPQCVCEGV